MEEVEAKGESDNAKVVLGVGAELENLLTDDPLLQKALLNAVQKAKKSESTPTSATRGEIRSLVNFTIDLTNARTTETDAQVQDALEAFQDIYTKENFTAGTALHIITDVLPRDGGAYLQNMDNSAKNLLIGIELNFVGADATTPIVINYKGFEKIEAIRLYGRAIVGYKNLKAPLKIMNFSKTSIREVDVTPYSETLELLNLDGDKVESIIALNHLPKLRRLSFTNEPEFTGSVDLRKSIMLRACYLNNTSVTEVLLPDNVSCVSTGKNVDSLFSEGLMDGMFCIYNCKKIKLIDASKFCLTDIKIRDSQIEKIIYDGPRQTITGAPEGCKLVNISE